ncbi:DUF7673 family protein [Endozoicomonas sp. NE40]|uniref:DUF7673 domain-containing protein n=1 Tax=Endozoicomonas lisbonensis TaxID=3120522 RepID=A0ABV2SGW2_9GAMM
MTIPNSVMNSLTEAFQPPERTVEEYAEAVTTLYNIARFVTSSGRCAAQLLLSGFNGDNWQLDITDLILLDRANFKTAMTYLECRTHFG